MKRFFFSAALSAILLLLGSSTVASARSAYLSPLSIVADGNGTLYVAEAEARQVAVVDPATGKVVKTLSLKADDNLTGMAISPDGGTLAVTVAGAQGELLLLDLASEKTKAIRTGHTPISPVFSADGKEIYLSNRFNNNVLVIDPAKGKEIANLPALREPFAIARSGNNLFVGNHLPLGSADGEYTSVKISVYDAAKRQKRCDLRLPNGSTGLRGMCASADGKFVYATHVLARYQLPTTQLERGWMNTNALTVIDATTLKIVNTVLLDDVDLGAANPWGVACTSDGKILCVAIAGTHEVAIIDRAQLHERLAKAAKNEKVTEVSDSAEDVPNDLSFLVDAKRRMKLAGNGPRGITVVGNKVYTAEYFTDSIGVVDLENLEYHRPKSLPLGPKKEDSSIRRGERFFNDADFCFQRWQSCASCHPGGRADSLNWDLLNDGMGNPKQTKSMLLAHVTPPAMITGIRGSAGVAVRAGLKHIQFAVRPEEDAVDIDNYLKSMEPVESPYLVNGKLSKSAKRGKKIFKKADCARCHDNKYLIDGKQHNVGLGIGRHKDTVFDTPTLIENWRTAPYLYDGRAATMLEVLTKYNKNDTHGKTSNLSKKELDDLVEYILSF